MKKREEIEKGKGAEATTDRHMQAMPRTCTERRPLTLAGVRGTRFALETCAGAAAGFDLTCIRTMKGDSVNVDGTRDALLLDWALCALCASLWLAVLWRCPMPKD